MKLSGVQLAHYNHNDELVRTSYLIVAHTAVGDDSLAVMIHDYVYNDERGYSVAEVCDPVDMLLEQYDGVAVCSTEDI